MAYTLGGVDIPSVYVDEQPEDEIIGEELRSADGTLRSDVIAVKRTWRLQTRPITKAQIDAVVNPLRTGYYAPLPFHHDTWTAGVTVSCRAKVTLARLLEPDGYWALGITLTEV
jgi:hypothetical protein